VSPITEKKILWWGKKERRGAAGRGVPFFPIHPKELRSGSATGGEFRRREGERKKKTLQSDGKGLLANLKEH